MAEEHPDDKKEEKKDLKVIVIGGDKEKEGDKPGDDSGKPFDDGYLDFKFVLDEPLKNKVVKVFYHVEGTGKNPAEPEDYVSPDGVVVFEPKDKVETESIKVIPDKIYEGDEALKIVVDKVEVFNKNDKDKTEKFDVDVKYVDNFGIILDDDKKEDKVKVWIEGGDKEKENKWKGDNDLDYKVKLDRELYGDEKIVVKYTTFDKPGDKWEAEAGKDYKPEWGYLVFEAGDKEKHIDIKVKDDHKKEGDEKVWVKIEVVKDEYVEAHVKDAKAYGTIIDDFFDHKLPHHPGYGDYWE